MAIKYDPVEETEEFRTAMKKIKPLLDKEFPQKSYRFGTCHTYWRRMKQLLKEQDVDWKSPSEMNPDVRFD